MIIKRDKDNCTVVQGRLDGPVEQCEYTKDQLKKGDEGWDGAWEGAGREWD